MPNRALITGITGQDGGYLAEWLLSKGYEVHGLVRPGGGARPPWFTALLDPATTPAPVILHTGDITDANLVRQLVADLMPSEIYHLAAQTQPGLSFKFPLDSLRQNTGATIHLLEACRHEAPQAKLFCASSSEIFGRPSQDPQDEQTPHRPVTPYGASKSCALQLARIYRDTHGLFVCNGIAYNHESPRRGPNFVTRKITMAAARAAAGDPTPLRLGNLDSARDWGYAPEFVQAMWLSLRQDKPDDYILATGTLATVRDFVHAAYATLGIELEFAGRGLAETARDRHTGKLLVEVDPAFFRPDEPQALRGDISHTRRTLGWYPESSGSAVAVKMALAEATPACTIRPSTGTQE